MGFPAIVGAEARAYLFAFGALEPLNDALPVFLAGGWRHVQGASPKTLRRSLSGSKPPAARAVALAVSSLKGR